MDFTGEFSRSPFVHKMFPHVKSEDFLGGEHIKHHLTKQNMEAYFIPWPVLLVFINVY